MAQTHRFIRFQRAEQLIKAIGNPELGSGQLYDRVKPLLQAEFGKRGGIRKQDFLPFAREVQEQVRRTQIIKVRDAPRMITETPSIRQAMRAPTRLKVSDTTLYSYYVDIKYKKRIRTKGGMEVRYTTLWIGDMTQAAFKKLRTQRDRDGQRTLNKQIVDTLIAHQIIEKYQPFEILGFWATRQRPEH